MMRILISLLLAGFVTSSVYAHSANTHNRSQEIVVNSLTDQPSSIYRFVTNYLDSDDGKRHYRIQIAIPKIAAPKNGYRAIYMLDGNAAMATLTDADVVKLNQREPTVLVAIGYDVATRNDPIARAYDYTPPVYEGDKKVENPVVLKKEGGGADIFLELLRKQIIPLVNEQVTINHQKTKFWGHSYGGLFVLYTLTAEPDLFSAYIAADPSVWWYNGAFADNWSAFDKKLLLNKDVSILRGTKPRAGTTPYQLDAANHKNREYKDPVLILQNIINGLAKNQARLNYITYPNAGHGDMIRKSLEYTLARPYL